MEEMFYFQYMYWKITRIPDYELKHVDYLSIKDKKWHNFLDVVVPSIKAP